jgi:hypothetical protein
MDSGKVSAGNNVPEKVAKKTTADNRPSTSNADKNSAGGKCPANSSTEVKQEPDVKKGTLGKSNDQTVARGKEKVPLPATASPKQPAVEKTAKSKTKVKEPDDIDDFESPKAKDKSKAADATDDGKKVKGTGKKAEPKPTDVKTKSIASYFMAKPKT